MASTNDIMGAIKYSMENDPRYPSSDMSFILQEPSSDSNKKLPLTAIYPVSATRIRRWNHDPVAEIQDDSDNGVGKRYFSEYRLSFQIDIWSTDKDSVDINELGSTLERDVLYKHSPRGPAEPWRDEHGNIIDSIYDFDILEHSRPNNLDLTSPLRRWRQDVGFNAYHTYDEAVATIESVDSPADGDFDDSEGDGLLRANENE